MKNQSQCRFQSELQIDFVIKQLSIVELAIDNIFISGNKII